MLETKGYLSFKKHLIKSIKDKSIIQLRLAHKRDKSQECKLVLVKYVILKSGEMLSFVYRYDTKDITKNKPIDEGIAHIEELLSSQFYQAELELSSMQYYLTIFPNESSKLRSKVKASCNESVSHTHDHEKKRMITAQDNVYLKELGVLTSSFIVKNKMQDKFKQINKYVEIIHDILKKTKLPENPHIVDMGSGKGYLTFALYDYFKNIRKEPVQITGVEIRKELVKMCNNLAAKVSYDQLNFIDDAIQNTRFDRLDFLIALHACDTATDDAIFHGIQSQSKLIVCAPCCHKQVRKNLHPTSILSEITQHGILKERQAEILTDTIRAKVLEAFGYDTRVFEFISTSHTPKNVLIVASLREFNDQPDPKIVQEINALKELFGLHYQHLEKLVGLV